MPAATWPGVPSECSVLMIDWMSLSSVSMQGKYEGYWLLAIGPASELPRPNSQQPIARVILDQSMPRQRRAPHVHKFGGASLADSAAVRRAVAIIQSHQREPTVVVVSAMAGVTDALLATAQQAGSGDERTLAALIGQLRTRHDEVARALLPAGRSRTGMLAHITEVFEELEALAAGLHRLRELTPRTADLVVSRGERLSARLLAGALEASGTKARYVDALEVVHTDDAFGQASPDFAHTDRSVQRVLGPIVARGVIPVVPGFIGATPDG